MKIDKRNLNPFKLLISLKKIQTKFTWHIESATDSLWTFNPLILLKMGHKYKIMQLKFMMLFIFGLDILMSLSNRRNKI